MIVSRANHELGTAPNTTFWAELRRKKKDNRRRKEKESQLLYKDSVLDYNYTVTTTVKKTKKLPAPFAVQQVLKDILQV